MNELSKLDPKEYGLEEEKVQTIEQAFAPKIAERDELSKIYRSIISQELTEDLCKQARECRLKLVKVRTGIADIHKAQKAFFLAAGRFVDAWKNKETLPVSQMEDKLSEIENYYSNLEKERIVKLEQDRTEELSKYTDQIPKGIGEFTEDIFKTFLSGAKIAYEKRIEEEKKEEEERIAREKAVKLHSERREKLIPLWNFIKDAPEDFSTISEEEYEAIVKAANKLKKDDEEAREKQRLENEKLKVEAEKQKKLQEEKLKKEREKLQKEQEEKARIEAELRAKKDAEEAAKKAAEEEAKKRAAAPDIEKLKIFVKELMTVEMPNVSDETCLKILANVKILLGKIDVYINQEINK